MIVPLWLLFNCVDECRRNKNACRFCPAAFPSYITHHLCSPGQITINCDVHDRPNQHKNLQHNRLL